MSDIIKNPCGFGGIRNDLQGSGFYGSPRGKRRHMGIDILCYPGQPVYAPIKGVIKREAIPYADDIRYSGCLIEGDRMALKLFYFSPIMGLIGQEVYQGEEIGIAQDITVKYGKGMDPHIHLEIISIDPLLIFQTRL